MLYLHKSTNTDTESAAVLVPLMCQSCARVIFNAHTCEHAGGGGRRAEGLDAGEGGMGVEAAVELEVCNPQSLDRPHAHARPPTASSVSVPSPMHTVFLREDGNLQDYTVISKVLSGELIDGQQHAKCVACQENELVRMARLWEALGDVSHGVGTSSANETLHLTGPGNKKQKPSRHIAGVQRAQSSSSPRPRTSLQRHSPRTGFNRLYS